MCSSDAYGWAYLVGFLLDCCVCCAHGWSNIGAAANQRNQGR